jgi:predicted acyl esterase
MKINRTLILFILSVQGLFAQYSYKSISVPMRDGKYLAADLYTIDTLTPKPTILIQTPYNKNLYHLIIGLPESQVPFDSINYNYLISDWRGFYGSASADSIGYDRGLDGYDLVEWIAVQGWSNGRIGTWGLSALGIIQFMTAKHRPPHLVCCVPAVSSAKTAYTDYYCGGDYLLEYTAMRASLGFTPENLILAHYKHDLFWTLAETLTDYPDSINVPMLLVTGWYDHNDDAPLEMFYSLRNNSAPAVRDKHKFMVGPWTHSGVGKLEQGELTYPDGVDSLRQISFRIFDHYLRQINNGYETEPVIRYYMMGENEWQTTEDWYTVSNRTDTLYLSDNGVLSNDTPTIVNPPDSFYYDPRNPCPSIGGNRFNPFNSSVIVGPRDQRDSVENRNDVLLYSTPILSEPLTIAGSSQVKLSVSSSCEDTDFTVRLTDVYPDGRSMLICGGIRRMRFRNSFSSEELMIPGNIYEVTIELKNIAYTFLSGHRLRIIISSSDYPIFHSNLNNGDSLYVPGDTVVALNKVYHSPGALSMFITKTQSSSGIFENSNKNKGKIENQIVLHGSAVEIDYCSAVVYDVTGREIKKLNNNTWDLTNEQGKKIGGGIYFVKDKETGDKIKLLIIK